MASPKLHEINALTTGRKAEAQKILTAAYQQLQKGDLFDGLSRNYQPVDEAGEKLPPEKKLPQLSVKDTVKSFVGTNAELIDFVTTQDTGNQQASADVIVDGKVLLKQVPVTTILFLLKQVEDFRTFIGHMPTPDPADKWTYDSNLGMLATAPTQTHRTKKQPRVLVKAQATPQHPAQTEVFQEDVLAGYWTSIKYSSRVPADVKNEQLVRVRKLRDALLVAKEVANNIEVTKRQIGNDLLGYVFGDMVEKK